MSANNYYTKKASKKQKRCIAKIQKECIVHLSDTPTRYLALLNAGLSTGLSEEQVLKIAGQYGEVQELFMVPNKSYCFLVCVNINDAENIYQAMHSHAPIGQGGVVIYMAYFQQLPSVPEPAVNDLPPGLYILHDFVSAEEEDHLLQAVGTRMNESISELKHRRVVHFGYQFQYDTNNVDMDNPLPAGMPLACKNLWPRLKQKLADRGQSVTWDEPDQLTVNEYATGQGIPPHVDTHSAFLEPILSLSLQSDIIMDFRHGDKRVSVLLPQRSLLVLIGEARYDWTHGITPRTMDVVTTKTGGLTARTRTVRTSLTFRRLRRAPCLCNYPDMCDTRLNSSQRSRQLNEAEAQMLEVNNVHDVYDSIAKHFSATRHTPWPKVINFLESFTSGSVILDIGCGNGKYLACNRDILMIGCDRSRGLLNACLAKEDGNSKVIFQCDCLHIPLLSNAVDGCISIAVIHHLATSERRLSAIKEMLRVLRPGGRALIYVWARDQRAGMQESSYLLQNKAITKKKATADQQRQSTSQQWNVVSGQTATTCKLPIHTNRTDFQQQDVLVPWKTKDQNQSDTQSIFLRYYHVFEEFELRELLHKLPGVDILQNYYDQGNHCVIFKKKKE